jgi:hypothetical protein
MRPCSTTTWTYRLLPTTPCLDLREYDRDDSTTTQPRS